MRPPLCDELPAWTRLPEMPMININPKMLPRLDEIEVDLLVRRARAEAEGWLGELEGIDLTLSFLRQKRDQTRRLARVAPSTSACPPSAPERD